MASLEVFHVDLECGEHNHSRSSPTRGGGGASSECFDEDSFSDAEEGSCYSQFYSTVDGSRDGFSFDCASDHDEVGEVLDSRRPSSVAQSAFSVDIENGIVDTKVHLERLERDCRICHLSLDSASPKHGIAIELGCSCKDDLAAAHKYCAEAWFNIKGNKICEICKSVASNVVGTNDESPQQMNETEVETTHTATAPTPPDTETRSYLNGHLFLNLLFAFMVFACIISWLFHFNIPA